MWLASHGMGCDPLPHLLGVICRSLSVCFFCLHAKPGRQPPVLGLAHHSAHDAPASRIRKHDVNIVSHTLHIRLHPAGNTLKISRHLPGTSQQR